MFDIYAIYARGVPRDKLIGNKALNRILRKFIFACLAKSFKHGYGR